MNIKNILKQFSEALFPESFTCDICGIETFDTNICKDCLKTITFNNSKTCPVCGRKTARSEICMECKAVKPLYSKAYSSLVYDGGAKILIAKFKNGEGYLKEYFADLITEKLKDTQSADYIVYVPMTKKACTARGYNQAELLAYSISERIGTPVLKDAIVKVKDSKAQKSLTRRERAKNLENCFKIEQRKELKGKTVLLVDDVLTTGATADEVCKKLLKAGVQKVYLATVASVEFKQNKKN